MSMTKYASFEDAQVLDLKGSSTKIRNASIERIADYQDYRTGDGYLYVRIRAISSRVNKNHDGWPSVELAGGKKVFARHTKQANTGFTLTAAEGDPEYGFATFLGKPNFIDHNNSDPSRARGVVVDAKLRVLPIAHLAAFGDDYWTSSNVDPQHLPPTEIELLIEIDAHSFPKYASAVRKGELDGFSMGCDCEESECSHCGHIATNPTEYCSHILMKGAHHDFKTADGKRISKKSYENCKKIKFFEISGVFEPADETALAREVVSAIRHEGIVHTEEEGVYYPDPLRGRYHQEVAQIAAEIQARNPDMPEAVVFDLAQRRVTNPANAVPQEDSIEEHFPKRWEYAELPGQLPPAKSQNPLDPYPGAIPGTEGPLHGFAEEMFEQIYPEGRGRPVRNDPITGAVIDDMQRTAENALPQSEHTKAPDEVDTMRQEKICPLCGNIMEGHTCDVCFLPGTLVRTSAGYKPIETIIPGDEVLGELGHFNPVQEVTVRHWDGPVQKIDGPSLVEPIFVTNNHPFKVLVGHHTSKTERCRPPRCERHSEFHKIHSLEWIHAGCLSEDSYILSNLPLDSIDLDVIAIPSRHIERRKYGTKRRGPQEIMLTDEMLWAIGLYIAEGSSGDRSITFSSHIDETEYQDRIGDLFRSLGYTTKLIHREDKPNSAWVNVNSSVLSDWFPEWLGKGCENKAIPSELMSLPIDRLYHVYRGVLDGDGCERANALGQTSKILALQMHEIARRLNLATTITRFQSPNRKEVFTLNNITDQKRAYHDPISDHLRHKEPRNTWRFEGKQLYRLRSVESMPYSGPVYNLRVANDPTYTVQNLAVHNCDYQEPPDGLNNPDLEKAKHIREEAEEQEAKEPTEESQGAPTQVPPHQPPAQQGSFMENRQQARNPIAASAVMSEMRWAPNIDLRTAGTINTKEQPVKPAPSTHRPTNVTVVKNPTKPVTSAMRTAQDLIQATNQQGDTMSTRTSDSHGAAPVSDTAADARVDVTGVGGVIEPSNESASKADAQVDLTGIGTTGTSDVDADKTESLPTAGRESDDSGFNTDKITEAIPTKTYGDSDGSEKGFTDPVTDKAYPQDAEVYQGERSSAYQSRPFFAYDATQGEMIQDGDPGSANKGTEPVDPVGKAQERVDVLKPATTPDNNSGPTSTWTGTDGAPQGSSKVYKQQDPVTTESISRGESFGEDGANWTSHVVACLKLADLEVDLGLTPKEKKYDRIAELETQANAEIAAQHNMLSRVRTAGLKKLEQARKTGATRLPSGFGQATAAGRRFATAIDGEQLEAQPGAALAEDQLDAGLFS